jgi:hypothetical protein
MFSLPVYIKGAGKDKPVDSRFGVAAACCRCAHDVPALKPSGFCIVRANSDFFY